MADENNIINALHAGLNAARSIQRDAEALGVAPPAPQRGELERRIAELETHNRILRACNQTSLDSLAVFMQRITELEAIIQAYEDDTEQRLAWLETENKTLRDCNDGTLNANADLINKLARAERRIASLETVVREYEAKEKHHAAAVQRVAELTEQLEQFAAGNGGSP